MVDGRSLRLVATLTLLSSCLNFLGQGDDPVDGRFPDRHWDSDSDADPDPDTDADTDSDTYTHVFRPRVMFIGGRYAYDRAQDIARPFRTSSGDVPPYLELEFHDRRYEGTLSNRDRCRVLVVPDSDDSELAMEFVEFTLSHGALIGSYSAVLFRLDHDRLQVVDAPYAGARGGPIPGCIEIQDDPARGFGDFNDGDFVGWVESHSWSIGLSAMASAVQGSFEGLSSESPARSLFDQGYFSGGTVRIQDPDGEFDIFSPGQYTLGFEVDSDFAPLEGTDGVSPDIPASHMQVGPDGVRPQSGVYWQRARFGFLFRG